jgi:hypothetical protein
VVRGSGNPHAFSQEQCHTSVNLTPQIAPSRNVYAPEPGEALMQTGTSGTDAPTSLGLIKGTKTLLVPRVTVN